MGFRHLMLWDGGAAEGDASLSRGGAEDGEDEDLNQQLGGDNEEEGDWGPKITSDVLRRLSIDSTWHLLQSTDKNDGDQGARKRAWKDNCLLLVQVLCHVDHGIV